MRRGNDGGLFCHILETGAIGSHLFDKYRQSSTFFQRQNRPFPPIPTRCSVPFCFTSFSFLSGGEKRTRAKAVNPLGSARRSRPSAARGFPANIFAGFSSFFFRSFSFCERKRTKKKAINPLGSARRARPSAERTFPAKNILRGFSFRKAPQGKTGNEWWGRAARWFALIPLPVKVSFLWFFLFFSRKKRKNRKNDRKKNADQ